VDISVLKQPVLVCLARFTNDKRSFGVLFYGLGTNIPRYVSLPLLPRLQHSYS